MRNGVRSLCFLTSVLAIMVAVLACGDASHSRQKQGDLASFERVKRSVAREFPEWKILEIGDLPADDQKLWREAHPQDEPGWISGRFRNKGELSYAVLLVPKAHTRNGFRLLLVTPQASGPFPITLIEKWDKPEPTLVISKVPPGEYWDSERTHSVKTVLDSVFLETLEVGGTLYYWEAGRFKKLIVSE